MKLLILLALTGIAGLFMIANSFSQGRNNLWPAAAIFLIIGGFLLTGPGLQIQDGQNFTYQTVDNSTVVETKKPIYKKVNNPLPGINSSKLLGMLYMIMGTGYIVMAAPGRFRTILSNR